MSKSMLRTRTLGYSLAILLGSFTGCSCQTEDASMANPEAVYQELSATYDGASNKTSVSARFRFGGVAGTNLRLDGQAGVKHNFFPLTEKSFTGAHYDGSGDGLVVDHTFEYTDIQGKVLKNSIQLRPIEFPADRPEKFSLANGLRIAFVGEPAELGENASLTIRQKNPKHDAQELNAQNQAVIGTREIVIPAESLKEFTEGEATIVLSRQRSQKMQEATSRGGRIAASYTTARRVVTIVK